MTEVQWLATLPDLRVLWLSDNPCAETPSYRHKVYLPLNSSQSVTHPYDAIQRIILDVSTVSTCCFYVPRSQTHMQVLQILPKLTKLDNDDVTAEERPDSPHTVSQAAEPQSSACTVPPSTEKPSAVVAEQPFLGANPVLEQVHQPAELQAALATPHEVLCPMYSYI